MKFFGGVLFLSCFLSQNIFATCGPDITNIHRAGDLRAIVASNSGLLTLNESFSGELTLLSKRASATDWKTFQFPRNPKAAHNHIIDVAISLSQKKIYVLIAEAFVPRFPLLNTLLSSIAPRLLKGNIKLKIAAFNLDGQLDTTFGKNGFFDFSVGSSYRWEDVTLAVGKNYLHVFKLIRPGSGDTATGGKWKQFRIPLQGNQLKLGGEIKIPSRAIWKYQPFLSSHFNPLTSQLHTFVMVIQTPKGHSGIASPMQFNVALEKDTEILLKNISPEVSLDNQQQVGAATITFNDENVLGRKWDERGETLPASGVYYPSKFEGNDGDGVFLWNFRALNATPGDGTKLGFFAATRFSSSMGSFKANLSAHSQLKEKAPELWQLIHATFK